MSSKVTVVETVYYTSDVDDPIALDSRYDYPCESEEQPYLRRILVQEEWQKIELGWLQGQAGLIVIQNLEGRHPSQTIPTDEEKQELSEKIVEVRLGDGGGYWLVGPRESFKGRPRFTAPCPTVLWIRSCSGPILVRVAIMPR